MSIRVGRTFVACQSLLLFLLTTFSSHSVFAISMGGNGVLELGTFEEVRKDGVPLKFKVMTIPPHLIDAAVDHMTEQFLPREPMCSHFKLHEDPASVQCIRQVWNELAANGAALIAIREGPEPEKDRIVGVNITFISKKDSKKPEGICGTKFEKDYDVVEDIVKKANMFEKYGADSYLSAFGLSVHRDYHGYKIGERLLQCRKPLCRALGIKFTGTVFTHPTSMYLSKKVGFVPLIVADYSTYEYNGEIVFKGKEGPFEQSAWDFS